MFCSATGPRASGTQNFIRAVSFFSGSQEGEDGSARDPVSTFPPPSLFASGQQGPVRGRDAFSRAPCPAVEPGECCTTHSDPTSRRSAFRVGPLGSTALPHRGYVYVSPGPACTAPGGLARAPQAVSLAPEDHQTRLRDSVRPASSQVQGQSVHLSVEPGCPCLACRSRGPTGEGRDTAGPSSRDALQKLYKGPYFIVPKKHGGLHPIWDLRVLNRALVKLPFKMLTQRRLFQCVRPFDWVAAIDLKDAYFHVSILPRFRFAYKGASIPVGPPLRAPQPVGASGQPGKEQTLPYAEDLFSRQGVGLGQPHSTSLRGACSVNAEMPGVSPAQEGGSTETFSEAPGAYGILSRYHAARIASYETASALASRPSPEMGMAPRHIPGLTHPVLPSHLQPMVGSCFLRAEVPLEQVSRHVVVSTDASATGWGAMCNGHAAAGLWTGPQLQWHINCLELLAVWLALRRFSTLLHEKHILVRSDNTATVAYINHQGGLRSRRMSQLARHLLLWSQKHLRSLRAVHVPGELNRAADELSRQHALPGEWRLHPEVLQLIWRRFGDAQVDLFASPDTSHCQLFFSLSEGTLGTDALACSWPRGLRKYAFPPVSLLAQTLCKVREDEEQVLLVAPYWPNRTWFPELMLLATAPPWQIPLRRDLLSQRGGTLWHPRPDLWNLHVWSLDGTRRF